MMKFKIRKGIWETSSSSASALAMISASGKLGIPQLTSTFKLIKGVYDTTWDGAPHVYLNSWMDKMSYIAEDTEEWHEMFRQATGQDFEMWDIIEDNEENREKIKDNGICYERLPFDENNLVTREPEFGYICGYNLVYDCMIIRMEDRKRFNIKPDLTYNCYLKINMHPDKKILKKHPYFEYNRLYDEDICEEFNPEFWREFIFNSAIAINIGGDAYCSDTQTIPKLGSPEDTKPLQRRGFAIYEGLYKNGTEKLFCGVEGTKIRIFDENSVPEYPESIDLKITDYCDNNCAFCYENCTADGKHGEKAKFLETLPEYVELAIGGGNVFSHPNYTDFLDLTKYVNMTIHSDDFVKRLKDPDCYYEDFSDLFKCKALGISVSDEKSALEVFKVYDGAYWLDYGEDSYMGTSNDYYTGGFCTDPDLCVDTVIHVVNGVISESALKHLYDKNLKLLVLGYKTKGRGVEYAKNPCVAENQKWLYDNIEEVAKHFKVVAFDTLALKQLDMKRFLTDEQWDSTFMGEDGLHSMYVDLVKGEYGISSTDDRRWPLTDDIRDMFRHVREVVLSENKK